MAADRIDALFDARHHLVEAKDLLNSTAGDLAQDLHMLVIRVEERIQESLLAQAKKERGITK